MKKIGTCLALLAPTYLYIRFYFSFGRFSLSELLHINVDTLDLFTSRDTMDDNVKGATASLYVVVYSGVACIQVTSQIVITSNAR